jgi:5-methylcytosine-specific restriction enzyme A
MPRPATEYDRRWRKFQRWYLAQPDHQWCHDCQPRLTPATEVHHIEKLALAPELKFDETNLMPLCKSCHTKRTNRGE